MDVPPLEVHFDSYSALKDAISNYERNNNIKLSVATSEKLKSYSKRSKRKKNRIRSESSLVYTKIHYVCQFRPGCEFKIEIKSNDGKLSIVRHISHTEHPNIILGNFQLTKTENKTIETALNNGASPVDLSKNLHKLTDNNIPKDVYLTSKFIHNRFPKNIKEITDNYAVYYEELKKSNTLKCIPMADSSIKFYQNETMASLLRAYGDMIFLDSIHNLIDIKETVMFWFVLNGEGFTTPVLYATLPDETSDCIRTVFTYIKENFPTLSPECFMTDKDLVFRSLLRTLFKESKPLLCFFHVIRVLYVKFLGCVKKMCRDDKYYYLKHFRGVVYPTTKAAYYNSLKNLPEEFYRYFAKNWDPIKSEWVRVFKPKVFRLDKNTNNTCEGFFSKIKKKIGKRKELNEFSFKSTNYIVEQYNSTLRKYTVKYIKQKKNIFSNDPLQKFKIYFNRILTVYGYNILLKQVNSIDEDTPLASEFGCDQCPITKLYKIPCKHIIKREDYYIETLKEFIGKRWHKSVFLESMGSKENETISKTINFLSLRNTDTLTEEIEKLMCSSTKTKCAASMPENQPQ